MRRSKLLVLAALALFAFGAVGASVASAEEAEEKNNPRVLILAGNISELKAELLMNAGEKSELEAKSGKTLTSKKVHCVANTFTLDPTENGKDANLAKATCDFEETTQGAVSCRSETAKGVKDPIGTLLVLLDLHIAAEDTSGGVLQPLLIAVVLGEENEEELTINCGGVKDKVKGAIGCLLLPGLTNIAANANVEVLCKAKKKEGLQETGTCLVLCELLTKTFLSNLGLGFEASSMLLHLLGFFNKDVFIDD